MSGYDQDRVTYCNGVYRVDGRWTVYRADRSGWRASGPGLSPAVEFGRAVTAEEKIRELIGDPQ